MATITRAAAANVSADLVGEFSGRPFLIEDIYPIVDGGRYPVKRVAGEPIEVWADIFRDGHDVIAAALSDEVVRAHVDGKPIRRRVVVPGRLVNLVV